VNAVAQQGMIAFPGGDAVVAEFSDRRQVGRVVIVGNDVTKDHVIDDAPSILFSVSFTVRSTTGPNDNIVSGLTASRKSSQPKP